MALRRLKNILMGKVNLPGLTVDQDKRWKLLQRLVAFDYPQSQQLLDLEKRKDPSLNGELSYLAAQASRPNWKVKEGWIQKLLRERKQLRYAEYKSVAYSLFPESQVKLRNQFAPEFLDSLTQLNSSDQVRLAYSFSALAPQECKKPLGVIEKALNSDIEWKALVRKRLRIMGQQFERCRKAISKAKNNRTLSQAG